MSEKALCRKQQEFLLPMCASKGIIGSAPVKPLNQSYAQHLEKICMETELLLLVIRIPGLALMGYAPVLLRDGSNFSEVQRSVSASGVALLTMYSYRFWMTSELPFRDLELFLVIIRIQGFSFGGITLLHHGTTDLTSQRCRGLFLAVELLKILAVFVIFRFISCSF
uniref:Uncharacterized protein n=2 Tax=Noccaea caerulescens TaxID=107243 RepID=A0A1J3IN38_NOCCA